MTWVFRYSESTLATRLVALGLADYAHDDGTNAWPSIRTLARKARVSERACQYALRKLEQELGEIEATGVTDAGTTIWRICMEKRPQLALGGADFAGVQDLQGRRSDAEGVQISTPGGAGSAPKPSVEPSVEPSVTPRPSDSARPEVLRLCNQLADAVAADGTRRPTVGQRWLDACRLLLDKDLEPTGEDMKMREKRVEFVIRWIHGTPGNFWASNVLSMPKLREKWPQLTKEIRREQEQRRKLSPAEQERAARNERRLATMRGGS